MEKIIDYAKKLLFDFQNPLFFTDEFFVGLSADIVVFIIEVIIIFVIIEKLNKVKKNKQKKNHNIWLLNQVRNSLFSHIENFNKKSSIKCSKELQKIKELSHEKISENSLIILNKIIEIIKNYNTKDIKDIPIYIEELSKSMHNIRKAYILYLKESCADYINLYLNHNNINYLNKKTKKNAFCGYGLGYTTKSIPVSFLWKNWDIFFKSWKSVFNISKTGENIWYLTIFGISSQIHLIKYKQTKNYGEYFFVSYIYLFKYFFKVNTTMIYFMSEENKCIFFGSGISSLGRIMRLFTILWVIFGKWISKVVTKNGARTTYNIAQDPNYFKKNFNPITYISYKKHILSILNKSNTQKPFLEENLNTAINKILDNYKNNYELSALKPKIKPIPNNQINSKFGVIQTGVFNTKSE